MTTFLIYVCGVADWHFCFICVSETGIIWVVRGICAKGKKIECDETA